MSAWLSLPVLAMARALAPAKPCGLMVATAAVTILSRVGPVARSGGSAMGPHSLNDRSKRLFNAAENQCQAPMWIWHLSREQMRPREILERTSRPDQRGARLSPSDLLQSLANEDLTSELHVDIAAVPLGSGVR